MNFYHRDVDWVFSPDFDLETCVDRTIRACRGHNATLMIAMLFWEPHQVDEVVETKMFYLVTQLKSAGIDTIGLMHHSYGDFHTVPFLELVKVDWCLWKTWNLIKVQKNSGQNLQWNSQADKFLFLTGKPYRINRARLLWELIQAGLEDRMVWSLFCHDESDFNFTCGQFPWWSKDQLRTWMNQHLRNPDNIELVIRDTPTLSAHYQGFPYDSSLFSNTLFRLVSETSFRNETELPACFKHYPTEKFYVTAFNSQPWILAADPGLLSYLEDEGYDGFRWALSEQYDHLLTHDQRTQAIVNCAKSWIESGMPDHDRVRKGVEHNTRHAESLALKQQDKLQDINQRYNLGFSDLTDLFPILDRDPYVEKYHGFEWKYM
jgi:hypothetical protein